MSTNKRPLTTSDLDQHFQEQLSFLETSSELYDIGREHEAKRIATVVRTLAHDTRSSKSLLGQLSRKSGRFIDSAFDCDPENVNSHGGLVCIQFGTPTEFTAPLDEALFINWVTFEEWWSKDVFVDDQGHRLSRRELILIVANQDGGAHIDSELNDVYARLSRENSLGWFAGGGTATYPVRGAASAAIRQIAHELLRTFKSEYRMKPINIGMGIVMNMSVKAVGVDWKPSALPKPEKFRRNEPCPCGSRLKFKKCHGKAVNC